MKTKFFYPNKEGKIDFTEKELNQLLDEIYQEGFDEGKKSRYFYYTTPYYTTTNPTVTWTNATTSGDLNKVTYDTMTNCSNNIKTSNSCSANLGNITNKGYTAQFDNN